MYQHIINQIPPHRVYIESHLGGGTIMKRKRPAAVNIGIDLDKVALGNTVEEISPGHPIMSGGAMILTPAMLANTTGSDVAADKFLFINFDAQQLLQSWRFSGDEFIYMDPPYLKSTRLGKRDIYEYEYTEYDHHRLLDLAKKLDCMVAVSGYWSDMYMTKLEGWRHITFTGRTRGSATRTEILWMNYPEPTELHDYRYLGENYRERERIKRKKNRWVKRLLRTDRLERMAILWAIQEAAIDHPRN